MDQLAIDDPCLLFALRRESQAFRRQFPPQQAFAGAPCSARFCGPSWLPVLVLETGIGSARIGAALKWVLGGPTLGNLSYRPKLVLSAGFAGALQKERRVGDVILAAEVADLHGNRWPTTWPADLPPGDWRPPLHRGRLLSVPHLVADPREKHTLGEQHQAVAADMESVQVAQLCAKHGMPFGCVRVISDDVNTALSPRLVSLLCAGRVSMPRVLLALLGSPRLIGECWQLARQTKYAGEQLGKALGELLTLTLPFGAEL